MIINPFIYATGGVAVIAIGLGVALALSQSTVAERDATIVAITAEKTTLESGKAQAELNTKTISDAKDAVEATVKDLQFRLSTSINEQLATQAKADAASKRASAANIRTSTAQLQLEQERQNAYQTDKSAAAWAAAPVPAAVADSLWRQYDETRRRLSGDNRSSADRCTPPRVCTDPVRTAAGAATAGNPLRALTNGQLIGVTSKVLMHVEILGTNVLEIGRLQSEVAK